MDKEHRASGQNGPPAAGTPQIAKPISTSPAQPATDRQLEKVEREMNAFEHATLRWTKAGFVVFAGTMVFIALQWVAMRGQLAEMKSGGTDTHSLAVAAEKQADASRIQSNNTAKLASAASDHVVKLQGLVAATASQNAVLQGQLEATDRPWIKVVGVVANHPIIFHANSGISSHGTDSINLGIKVIVQNVGRSVALDVTSRAEVVFVSMAQGASNNPFNYPVDRQRAFCSKPNRSGLPINLFPGEDNRDQAGDDHDEPINGNTFTVPQDPAAGIRIMPYFVGCVDYRIGTSGKIHQSGFIYAVQQAISGQQMNRGMLIVGNDIAMIDLRFERFVFGGFYAN